MSDREKRLERALRAMLSGWKHIRSFHDDLYGVGWNRAQQKAEEALVYDDDGEECTACNGPALPPPDDILPQHRDALEALDRLMCKYEGLRGHEVRPSDERDYETIHRAIAQHSEQHPDDSAVDRFAEAMKSKLKWEREERGRGGWDDAEQCSDSYLANLLVEHLRKGNPGTFEDVANFSMMLHQRGAIPTTLAEAANAQHSEPGWNATLAAAPAPDDRETDGRDDE